MHRRPTTSSMIAAVTVLFLGLAQAGWAHEPPGSNADSDHAWAPAFYGFCMEIHDAEKRSIPEQAAMLRELGFDGVGYPLWLDDNLQKNLQTLDEAQIDVYQLYTTISLKPDTTPYDPRLLDAMRKLKGRPVTVSVLLVGLSPAAPQGMEPAVKILRELGDVAAENGIRISIYHHTGNWTESLRFALDVVNKANHPQVGANFNLCHWLKIDADAPYAPVLRANANQVFAVTINGAQRGADTWTHGLIQPLDRGDFDNRQLLTTLRQVGYRGPVGLMCYGIPGDAREHLERSVKVWKTWQSEWSEQ